MSIKVRGYWRGLNKSITYGYCSCGREVRNSEEYTDEKCPMCGAKLEWDIEDESLWIHGRNT